MQITQSKSWDISHEVLNTVACDLITAAVEGGTGYWASVSDYRWGDPGLGHSHKQANGSTDWQPGDVPYATVTMHSDVDGESDFEPVTVDAAKMIEAINKVMTSDLTFYTAGYNKTFKQRLAAAFDEVANGVPFDRTDFDSDASDADCMMQIAVLGSVTYG